MLNRISANKASRILGCSRTTTIKWARAKQIPATLAPNGRYVFDPESLKKFIAARTDNSLLETHGIPVPA